MEEGGVGGNAHAAGAVTKELALEAHRCQERPKCGVHLVPLVRSLVEDLVDRLRLAVALDHLLPDLAVRGRDVEVGLDHALFRGKAVVAPDADSAGRDLVVAGLVPVGLDLVGLAQPLEVEPLGAGLRDEDRLDHSAMGVRGRVERLRDGGARLARHLAGDNGVVAFRLRAALNPVRGFGGSVGFGVCGSVGGSVGGGDISRWRPFLLARQRGCAKPQSGDEGRVAEPLEEPPERLEAAGFDKLRIGEDRAGGLVGALGDEGELGRGGGREGVVGHSVDACVCPLARGAEDAEGARLHEVGAHRLLLRPRQREGRGRHHAGAPPAGALAGLALGPLLLAREEVLPVLVDPHFGPLNDGRELLGEPAIVAGLLGDAGREAAARAGRLRRSSGGDVGDQADEAVGEALGVADLARPAVDVELVEDFVLRREEGRPGEHVEAGHELEGVFRGGSSRQEDEAQVAGGHDHVVDAARVGVLGRRVDDRPEEVVGLVDDEQLAVEAARRAGEVAALHARRARPHARHLVGGVVGVHRDEGELCGRFGGAPRDFHRRGARVEEADHLRDGLAKVRPEAAREHHDDGAHIPEGHRDGDGEARLAHPHEMKNQQPARIAFGPDPVLGVAHHRADEVLVVLEHAGPAVLRVRRV